MLSGASNGEAPVSKGKLPPHVKHVGSTKGHKMFSVYEMHMCLCLTPVFIVAVCGLKLREPLVA